MDITGLEIIAQGQVSAQKTSIAASKSKVSKNDKALMDACQQFESIFIKQMLDSMRKSVSKSGFIDGGMTEKIFEDMLYDNYAQKMSTSGDFGLSKSMFNQMKAKNGYEQTSASTSQHSVRINRVG